MAAQLDYGFEMKKGTPGGVYDLSDKICVSRTVEAEDGKILNGMAVAVGTAAGVQVIVPNGTAAIEGVVVRGGFNAENDKNGNAMIPKGASISVMTEGKIWVRLAKDSTTDSGYVEPTYGQKLYVVKSGAEAGAFTNKSEGTTAVNGTFIGGQDGGIAPAHIQ